jgi:POT family proton-dependent oligopeptide transporter
MATNTDVAPNIQSGGDLDKHPPGLYALFATEMWERFSFYSMLALFTLYMQDGKDGFSWTPAQATGLYANYLAFVYASPLIGGWIADKKLGYRKAVMLGGIFFVAGHALLAVKALWAVYAALTCLVIGNGFFKPNVSTMVGNLYPEGSKLKDRAYNIFYMGINIGATTAPIVMEIVRAKFGFHPAFTIAAFGMLISVGILWKYKNIVEDPEALKTRQAGKPVKAEGISANAVDNVPDWKRITALVVIFAIVIVFWMIFHQNGSTLTYWADDNTDWKVSGIISNSINPAWVVALTFPLVWFWKWLSDRGKEPSTPTKIAIGMFLTGISFFIMYTAAKSGEGQEVRPDMYATGSYRITERSLDFLKADGVPEEVLQKLTNAKDANDKFIVKDRKFAADEKASGEANFTEALNKVLTAEQVAQVKPALLNRAFIFKVSPFWLILAYAVISLGELMLSPMGLSLVSKVAPLRVRGLMMGGWFVATAIGNKLTAIGVFWTIWKQSSFFIILACMAFFMSVVLALLLKPLKKSMPGV